MLHGLSESELRQICRERIESLEHWLRTLIDQTLTKRFGDYLSYADEKGNRVISTAIHRKIVERQAAEPNRYGRLVDAMLLDDAVEIICKPHLFGYFSAALADAFPQGREVAKLT